MCFLNKKIILFSTTLVLSLGLYAQKDSNRLYYSNLQDKWLIEIPLWIPGFRGQLSYGEIELSTETPKEDIDLERIEKDTGIEFYLVGNVSYRSPKFWFQLDAFSGKVGNTFTLTPIQNETEKELAHLSIEATIPRVLIGYSVWKKKFNAHADIEIIPYTGLRYMYMQFESENSTGEQVLDVVNNWFEPLLGISVPFHYKRFRFDIQADMGANSSKNSTMINSSIKYKASKLIAIKTGWSSFFSNHHDSVNGQELDFTLNLQGPILGVGFHF